MSPKVGFELTVVLLLLLSVTRMAGVCAIMSGLKPSLKLLSFIPLSSSSLRSLLSLEGRVQCW